MERLNEIMARTGLRRSQGPEQRAPQAVPSQVQRPAIPSRRPYYEQTARLEPAPYVPQAREQRAPPPQDRAGFVPTRDSTYPAMPRPDVQEEWEDDTASMRYGDWENDRNGEQSQPPRPRTARVLPETSRAAARISQSLPAGARQFVTRELHAQADLESSVRPPAYTTRSLQPPRDDRDIQAILPRRPLPAPPQASQEPRRSHRFTQSSKPQAITRASQDASQEAPRPSRPLQQPVREEQPAQLIPAPYRASTGVCPICKGAGFLRADVPYGHPNFGKPIACECKEVERKEKRRRQLQEMSNLGDLKDKTFESFRHNVPGVSRSAQDAYQVALKYAQDPQGWLVFEGPNGCGKTHLAAAIANQYLEDGAVVLFITVIDLLEHLRATFAPTSTVIYDQLFSSMREAGLLVLDDLGAQQSSPWANEKLFQLLNYRYNSGMPTVITTNNIGLQSIEERIRSRMTDTGLVTRVTFDGASDYRTKKSRGTEPY